MKSTGVLKEFFGMKEPHELDGYENSDGSEIKSKLQGFAAEIKRLSPEEKAWLTDEAAKALGVEVEA